jgi:cysteine desulfurase
LIYLDNNATTRLDPRVLERMMPLLSEHWGNAGSGHSVGRPVRKLVAEARRDMGALLDVAPEEIVITGSGTEADNLAIRGVVAKAKAPRHLICSAVEHPAVLETCRALEREGLCALSVVPVDGDGRIDLEAMETALRPGETCLVSVMWTNNETGVIHPIEAIGQLAHAAGARFHVDAVQSVGKLPLELDRVAIDLLSMSAHKFHGPKGVGALIVRKGVELAPAVTGGGQERGRRSGTENPAGIVGLAAALEFAIEGRESAARRMTELREGLERALIERVQDLRITGTAAPRVCNTTHFTVPKVEAEAVLIALDRDGIACSSGSACSTGALEPSHVLLAMGVAKDRLHGALRLSLSRETTPEEMDEAAEKLVATVGRLKGLAEA